MLPIAVPRKFRIIAHRGASAYAPENTMAAFSLAQKMQIAEIELDAQLSADGVVVLCHDSSLARYGHGDRLVETLTWEELRTLDMGSWYSPFLFGKEPMLTLDRLFSDFAKAFVYHVEIKGRHPGLPSAVIQQIIEHDFRDQCFITSFSYAALLAMRELDQTIRLGWLVREVNDKIIEQAAALNLAQLCPFAGTVDRATVEQARTVAPEVRSWGLLGQTAQGQAAEVLALIENVLSAGCDGVTINWPDWLVHT